jgi:hypothetical protein
MKLFGKRKKSASTPSDASTEPNKLSCLEGQTTLQQPQPQPQSQSQQDKNLNDGHISSYFSSDFKPPSCLEELTESSTPSRNLPNNKDTKQRDRNNPNDTHDIEALLAMDSSQLNAKQRRVLRRHQERMGVNDVLVDGSSGDTAIAVSTVDATTVPADAITGSVSTSKNISTTTTSTSSSSEEPKEQQHADCNHNQEDNHNEDDNHKNEDIDHHHHHHHNQEQSTLNHTVNHHGQDNANSDSNLVEKVADQLKGLNSKERRKLLRQLASQYDDKVLEKAMEASKQIAQENEAKQQTKEKEKEKIMEKEKETKKMESLKRKSNQASSTNDCKENANNGDINDNDGGNDAKRRKKWKDFSHLPPEERERREKQRQMQQEAAEQRAALGIDAQLSNNSSRRHPLNSERRRANRRKPGKAGKMAQLKKELKEKQQNLKKFNATGYKLRHFENK